MSIYLERAKSALSEIKKLRSEIGIYYNCYLNFDCPLKQGDIVKIRGYSYTGKKLKISDLEVCERIDYDYNADTRKLGFYIRIVGNVLKKNGEVGTKMCLFDIKIEEVEALKNGL